MPGYDLLLTGPSNYGLADPGQSTALSLAQVSSALALVSPTFDSVTLLKLLSRLATKVGAVFRSVQTEMDEEEQSLQTPVKATGRRRVH